MFSPIYGDPSDWRIGSPYGMRVHPFTHERRMHGGIDIGAPVGTPVYSVTDGIVRKVWNDTGYGGGLSLRVFYPSLGIQMGLAHLNRTHVSVGQRVYPGQHIADTGNTGKFTTGPHLHLTLRSRGGATFDPMRFFLKPRGTFNDGTDRAGSIINKLSKSVGGGVNLGIGVAFAGATMWLGRKQIARWLRSI